MSSKVGPGKCSVCDHLLNSKEQCFNRDCDRYKLFWGFIKRFKGSEQDLKRRSEMAGTSSARDQVYGESKGMSQCLFMLEEAFKDLNK